MCSEFRPTKPADVHLYDAFKWVPTDARVYKDLTDSQKRFHTTIENPLIELEKPPTPDRISRDYREYDIDYIIAGEWEVTPSEGRSYMDNVFHIMFNHPAAQGRAEIRLGFEDVQPFIDMLQHSWDYTKAHHDEREKEISKKE